ncbi:MAG: hypothetical protein V3U76_13590 [Granulosicoccus sp.]
MIPLFFAMPMIGKLIDLKQTSVLASRYAAWEATVASGDGAFSSVPAEIAARFYGEQSSTISSSGADGGDNPLWGDTAIDSSWLGMTAIRIDGSSITAIPYTSLSSNSIALGVGEQIEKAGRKLGSISGGSWDMPGDGLTRTGVSVHIRSNDWLALYSGRCGDTDAFGCLTDTAVIMVDGWSAGSDAQAKVRVKALVPAGALDSIGDALSVAGRIPLFPELKKLNNMFGYVDTSALPDRALRKYPE